MNEDEIDYFTRGYKEGFRAGYEGALLVLESNIETLHNEGLPNKIDGMLDFVIRKEKEKHHGRD